LGATGRIPLSPRAASSVPASIPGATPRDARSISSVELTHQRKGAHSEPPAERNHGCEEVIYQAEGRCFAFRNGLLLVHFHFFRMIVSFFASSEISLFGKFEFAVQAFQSTLRDAIVHEVRDQPRESVSHIGICSDVIHELVRGQSFRLLADVLNHG
jgi:hypothetical protein